MAETIAANPLGPKAVEAGHQSSRVTLNAPHGLKRHLKIMIWFITHFCSVIYYDQSKMATFYQKYIPGGVFTTALLVSHNMADVFIICFGLFVSSFLGHFVQEVNLDMAVVLAVADLLEGICVCGIFRLSIAFSTRWRSGARAESGKREFCLFGTVSHSLNNPRSASVLWLSTTMVGSVPSALIRTVVHTSGVWAPPQTSPDLQTDVFLHQFFQDWAENYLGVLVLTPLAIAIIRGQQHGASALSYSRDTLPLTRYRVLKDAFLVCFCAVSAPILAFSYPSSSMLVAGYACVVVYIASSRSSDLFFASLFSTTFPILVFTRVAAAANNDVQGNEFLRRINSTTARLICDIDTVILTFAVTIHIFSQWNYHSMREERHRDIQHSAPTDVLDKRGTEPSIVIHTISRTETTIEAPIITITNEDFDPLSLKDAFQPASSLSQTLEFQSPAALASQTLTISSQSQSQGHWSQSSFQPRTVSCPSQTLQCNQALSQSQKSLRKGILVVEDSYINRYILMRHLNRLTTLTVHEAQDGHAAVQMMSGELAQGIAIIFMDLMLPVMDGREAARCIRELGITVPIVASSIAVSPGDKAKLDLSEFGITDVLAKPFGKAELLQILLQHNIEVKETFATSTETSPRNSIAGRDNVVAVDGQVLGQTLIDLTESATRKGGRNESKGIDESGSKSNSKYSPSISKTQVLVVQSKSKGKECLCEVLESFDSVVVQQAETIVDACRLLDSSAQHINNKDDPSTESTFTINTNELKIVFLCSDLPESWVEAADEFRRKGFGGAIILALPMEEDAFLSKDDIAKVNDVVRAPPTIKQVEDLFAKWGISVSAARSSIAESSFSYPQDLAPAILIIDDSSIFRTILRRMLEGICVSISIHEACDGREALDKLSSTRFSLVFMDADLFLVDHINNTYPEVHIVVISSYDLSPDTLESLCGKRVHQIWEKPVSRQQVLNVIQYFNITHVTPAGTLGRTVSSSEKQLGSPSRTSMNKKVVFEDELPAPPPPVNRRKVPETSKGRRRHSVCIGEDMAKLIESAVVQEEYTEKEPPSEGAIFGCTSEQTCVDNNKTPSISNSHPPCPTRRTTSLPRSVSSVRRIFGGGKILIVEESLVERKTMARLFYEESPDLEVVEADRVADALRLCLKNQYNLIVINLETRGMKGEEVAARIRNMGVNCPIFAVADKFSLNAYAWPLKHAGILDVFTKPLSRLEVAKMLLHTSNNPSSSTRVDSNPGHGRRMSTPAALQDIENFKSMRRSRSNQATQLATEFV